MIQKYYSKIIHILPSKTTSVGKSLWTGFYVKAFAVPSLAKETVCLQIFLQVNYTKTNPMPLKNKIYRFFKPVVAV